MTNIFAGFGKVPYTIEIWDGKCEDQDGKLPVLMVNFADKESNEIPKCDQNIFFLGAIRPSVVSLLVVGCDLNPKYETSLK